MLTVDSVSIRMDCLNSGHGLNQIIVGVGACVHANRGRPKLNRYELVATSHVHVNDSKVIVRVLIDHQQQELVLVVEVIIDSHASLEQFDHLHIIELRYVFVVDFDYFIPRS